MGGISEVGVQQGFLHRVPPWLVKSGTLSFFLTTLPRPVTFPRFDTVAVRTKACKWCTFHASVHMVQVQHTHILESTRSTFIPTRACRLKCINSILATKVSIGSCIKPTDYNTLGDFKIRFSSQETVPRKVHWPLILIQIAKGSSQRSAMLHWHNRSARFEVGDIVKPTGINVEFHWK